MSIWFDAILDGNLKRIEKLIDKVDIDMKNDNGYTALQLAFILKNFDIVKLLINDGANVNLKDSYGQTPLMLAVVLKKFDIVKLLINSGAKLDIQDDQGNTALIKACSFVDFDIVKLLIDSKANVNIVNNINKNALEIISAYGSRDSSLTVELLLFSGSNIRLDRLNNATPKNKKIITDYIKKQKLLTLIKTGKLPRELYADIGKFLVFGSKKYKKSKKKRKYLLI